MKTLFIVLTLFFSAQSDWLQKAEESKPALHERIVQPVSLVDLQADASCFQGWRMVPVGSLEDYAHSSMKDYPSVIVDFGEHVTGWFSFCLQTTKRCADGPLKIRFTFAEVPAELTADWDHYTGWLTSAWKQEEVMTVFDLDSVLTIPRRLSGRYMKIELLAYSKDFDFRMADMSFRAVSSASSQPIVQPRIAAPYKDIQRVALKTLSECMQTVYEDGPKRDKRLWAGDLYLESLANVYSFCNHQLTKRCLYLFAGTADEEGRIYGNVFETPVAHPQLESHPEDYALLWCVALYNYWQASKDTVTAIDLYPVMVRQLEYARSIYGQYADHWLFFDWRDNVNKDVAMKCLTVYAHRQCAELAAALGLASDAKSWRQYASKQTTALRKAHWNKSVGLMADKGQYNEITQIWAVLSQVLTPKEGMQALRTMKSREDVLRLGTPYANHYYVEALIRVGLIEEAKQHILSYWGDMVRKGADTFWEVYDPSDEQLSPYDFAAINSYCHAWSCTPVYFFGKYPEIFRPAVRTEPLQDAAWNKSEWISVKDAPVITHPVYDGSRAADGANWFVCSLPKTKPIRSATWMTTSLGVYQLFVNGMEVGEEVLKPGFTHYAKTKRSFTYDITPLLSSHQSNTLAAQVTPGWWADKIITPAETVGMYGRKCAFRAVLRVEYEDGSEQWIGTDTLHWQAGMAGPVTHAAIFDGEEYDARIPMGYDTPSLLATPEINEEFKGDILPSNGAEVYLRYDLALAPQQIYVYSNTEHSDSTRFGQVVIDRTYHDGQTLTLREGERLVLDFGQNAAAVPEFVFEADEGVTLIAEPGELLNDSLGSKDRGMDGPEGSVHRTNLRIPDTGVTLRYTFGKGGKSVNYHPQCTFFGYRYMSLKATGTVHIRSVRSIPVSSITPELEIGHITTGNALVNRLIQNTVWGQRSNYLSVPTDCPQRNERLGWTADTQVFAETGTYFANTDAFFRKWLRDLRDTQKENGGYPGVAPFGQYGSSEVDMARVGWSDAGIIVPWTVWKQFGDTALINEHWASMERYILHGAAVRFDHTALFEDNGGYQWGDWLSYEALESFTGQPWDANGLRPEAAEYWSYLYGSYWIIDAGMMRDMARATGRDTVIWSNMVAEAKAYMRERFLLPDGSFRLDILNTMQTPSLFALHNGLLDGQAKENMKQRLRNNFQEHHRCLQTGFLGTSILMRTLTDNGMTDIAYDLLFQRRNPSWLYSVDNGATTIWERWNSYTIERGMAPNGMNSFNHYAYGCVCQWLWQTAAGIQSDPLCAGFKHIILKPLPDPRLGFVNASYQSAAGLIRSEWHYEGDTCVWTFTVPQGATATVSLPSQSASKEYGSGTYTLRF